jgi:hypothetical protein
MIEVRRSSRRATAPLRGSSWYSTTRITADKVSAAVESTTTAETTSTATIGTAATTTGVGMATAVRTSFAVVSERRVRGASEHECHNRCKQETYGCESHHFISPSSHRARLCRNRIHCIHMGRLKFQCPIVSCRSKPMAEESKRSPAEMKGDIMSQSQQIAGKLQDLADN